MTFRDETYDFGLAPGERFEPDEEDEAPFDLTRPHVMTVLGPIEPDDLGVTLLHAPVVRDPREAEATAADPRLDNPAGVLAALEDAYNVGLRAIVDATTSGEGSDVAQALWIAQRSPVHLIVVAGSRAPVPTREYPEDESIEELAARIAGELTVGIDGTPVKAGVIMAETGPDRITAADERALRAAARAHLATGAPIAAWSAQGTVAVESLAILREEGVDPARVILGNLDVTLDEAHLLRVLDAGAYASFDRIGETGVASDADRAAMVKRLVDAGYGDRLLLSGDTVRTSSFDADGGPGWCYLVEGFPLLLMDAGLDAPTVRRLFVDNPARALTIRQPVRPDNRVRP
jgi:predicted metal-dependent phosphotriesterase family hydrolase